MADAPIDFTILLLNGGDIVGLWVNRGFGLDADGGKRLDELFVSDLIFHF